MVKAVLNSLMTLRDHLEREGVDSGVPWGRDTKVRSRFVDGGLDHGSTAYLGDTYSIGQQT